MSRDIPPGTDEATRAAALSPIGMVELDFASGFVRMWTGIGDLVWDGPVFTGSGSLGKISTIEETVELRAVGIQLELSGIPPEVLSIANNESWHGRQVRVYFGVLDDRRAFVGEPLQIFSGLMDQMVLVEGSESKITLTCESQQIDLERTKARRYTAEDQRSEYPGDAGMDSVTSLQELEIVWGG